MQHRYVNPYSEITLRVGLDTHHTYIISRSILVFNIITKMFGFIFLFFFIAVQTNRRVWKIVYIQNRRIFLY